LLQRIAEHKGKSVSGFTEKYNVTRLVYFEEHEDIEEMARREKRLKNWCRKWKLDLIEKMNPEWSDLSECIDDF
jgi:putative endonuclease